MLTKEQILKQIDEAQTELVRIEKEEARPVRAKKAELEAQLKEYDAEKVTVEKLDFDKIKLDYAVNDTEIIEAKEG